MSPADINWEFSAQRTNATPNPMLGTVLSKLEEEFGDISDWSVADQGCGKLRHYGELNKKCGRIVLVDTETQLGRDQKLFDLESTSIRSLVDEWRDGGVNVSCVSAEGFATSEMGLDLILCIAVLDVVPPRVRTTIIEAGARNLRRGGIYAIVVPRNDQSITKRCTDDNAYADGHLFHHHGLTTFYRNFKSLDSITRRLKKVGLTEIEDLSNYRQGCLLARKP